MTDREKRERLEQVQTRLRDIGPELELAESPGFSERLGALQSEVRLAREGAREAGDRLTDLRSQLEAAEQEVDTLNLAAQAKQTENPPAALSALLAFGVVIPMITTMVYVAQSRMLSPLASIGICVGCAFLAGVLLRTRVRPPKRLP